MGLVELCQYSNIKLILIDRTYSLIIGMRDGFSSIVNTNSNLIRAILLIPTVIPQFQLIKLIYQFDQRITITLPQSRSVLSIRIHLYSLCELI